MVLLESASEVRFSRVYFTIFRAGLWKIFIFLLEFVAGNSNKLQKLGLERKINWALNVFTLGPMAQGTLVERKKRRNIW